jgi:hypothetical protein
MADILASGVTNPLGNPHTIAEDLGYTPEASIPFPIMLSKSGGMGFQYEGGLITVIATNPQVRVTFDRPMTYNGDFTPNPGGPFSIDQPVLTANALALDVPITVAPSVLNTPILTLNTPLNPELIGLAWDEPVSLVSEIGWTITGSGPPIDIIDVYPNPPNGIYVQISEGQDATQYYVNIPPGYVVGTTSGKVNLALSLSFIAVASKPVIYTVVANSPTSITIAYNEPMDYGSVTNVNNYSIPGLTIIGIEYRDNDKTYTIRTSPMVPNTLYALTVTGVMDAHGNTIL